MLVRIGKVMVGEVSVFEELFPCDTFSNVADIEAALYWAIRNNVEVVYSPMGYVDVYVFGTEYLVEHESYYSMSLDSIKIAVASTLVNFVVIEEPIED